MIAQLPVFRPGRKAQRLRRYNRGMVVSSKDRIEWIGPVNTSVPWGWLSGGGPWMLQSQPREYNAATTSPFQFKRQPQKTHHCLVKLPSYFVPVTSPYGPSVIGDPSQISGRLFIYGTTLIRFGHCETRRDSRVWGSSAPCVAPTVYCFQS